MASVAKQQDDETLRAFSFESSLMQLRLHRERENCLSWETHTMLNYATLNSAIQLETGANWERFHGAIKAIALSGIKMFRNTRSLRASSSSPSRRAAGIPASKHTLHNKTQTLNWNRVKTTLFSNYPPRRSAFVVISFASWDAQIPRAWNKVWSEMPSRRAANEVH